MLAKLTGSTIVFFFALISAVHAAAAAITPRADTTVEVEIPNGESITKFCKKWHDKCVE
ncbi:hypothetical protein PILCRDRAFT_10566 [Piloderma croceum F 1598]|uniref:Uncharacterized protein n=1 Tax=Piloderma croceum (strain F 1598) TaxID=765440 RepID=A0A0C3BPD6_PILCF|nr:hypothetical protein PILCRDRAFT_10566 [Piloderma croceum F 1598]